MRERVGQVVTVLVAGVLMAGCTSASGVNTQELTTSSATTTVLSASSIISAAPPSASAISPSLSAAPTAQSSAVTETSLATDQEAADRRAIEAQWDKFWQVYLDLPHTSESDRQAIAAEVAIEPGLTNLLTDAQTVQQKGWDSYGQIVHRISWPQPVDGQSTAVIADCQDTSQAGSVETSSGYKMTVGVERNSLQGSLVRGEDGVWRVQQAFYLKDEPC